MRERSTTQKIVKMLPCKNQEFRLIMLLCNLRFQRCDENIKLHRKSPRGLAKATKRYRIDGKTKKRTSTGERYKKFHYTRLSPDRARANARRDAVRGTLSQSAFVHCSLKDVMRFRNNNTLDRTQVGIRGQLHHLASSRWRKERKKGEKGEYTRADYKRER